MSKYNKTIKIALIFALLFSCWIVFVIYNEKLYTQDTKTQDNNIKEKSIISNYYPDEVIDGDVVVKKNDEESKNKNEEIVKKNDTTTNKNNDNKEKNKQSNITNKPKENNNIESNANNNNKQNTNNEEQTSSLNEEKENNEANQQTVQQEDNYKNDNSVDTNNLDYNIHRGRIDCSSLEDCMNKSMPIQYQFKKSILNSYYIEVIAKNDETLGYFIEYIFKEHNYGSKDECESVGNKIKQTLPSKVKGYECSLDGNLKIITDY